MAVNSNDIEFYQKNGYVHIPNFLSPSDVSSLKQAIQEAIKDATLPEIIRPHVKYMGTKYHLDSVDSAALYFESNYVKDGKLIVPVEKAVHKIGHGMHVKSQTVKAITFRQDMKSAIKEFTGFNSVAVVQSMFLLKQPKVGEASPVHIDETYLMTDPPGRVAGIWIALDDSTEGNGCLEFLPGSHKTHVVTKKWVRNSESNIDEWKSIMKLTVDGEESPVDEKDFVKVPVSSGGLVLLHGRVLHKSNPNNSPDPRSAYTFHVYDRDSQWSPLNWIQEKDNYKFPILF